MLSMHLRQMLRKSGRIVLYIVIIALLTAFFCTSLNLYTNSVNNLELAAETYTTIAVVELYANVDNRGNLTDDIMSEDYGGYQSLTLNGYDFYPLTTASSVIKYDLRGRYGAYSEENVRLNRSCNYPSFTMDVIHFRINPEDNVGKDADFNDTILYTDDNGNFKILDVPLAFKLGTYSKNRTNILLDVLETAVDLYSYDERINTMEINLRRNYFNGDDYYNSEKYEKLVEQYKDELEALHYNTDVGYVGLEPGVEYIGVVWNYVEGADKGFGYIADNGKYRHGEPEFIIDRLFNEIYYTYTDVVAYYGERVITYGGPTEENPFWLMKYEDVQSDPELKAKYEQISRAFYINARSFGVIALDDMMGVPAFHMGNIYMREGRCITDEEFAEGTNVCIVNAELANKQGWEVGTKIKFDFYEYNYFSNAYGDDASLSPLYRYTESDNFFDGGEYEIVGIFDTKPMVGNSEISQDTLTVPWNTIYIPENSLENAPEEETRPVNGSLLTLWIENGKVNDFLESAEETGIFDRDGYDIKLTFYDQGYSRIQPSLETLSGTAELLLVLSSTLLVIATIMIAFFYANSQKHNVGTMRLLGCSKLKCFVAVLLSAALIVLVGAAAGSITGHMLTETVGEKIMTQSNATPEEFLAFSAYIIGGSEVDMELTVGAESNVSITAFAVAAVLFMLSATAFVLRYIGREPRELLPRTGE